MKIISLLLISIMLLLSLSSLNPYHNISVENTEDQSKATSSTDTVAYINLYECPSKYYRQKIEQYKKFAFKSANISNVPPSIIIAVAINESGLGRSFLSKEHNNFFGIKYYSNTYFSKGGGKYHLSSKGTKWRSYESAQASFIDFGYFIQNTSKYNDGSFCYRDLTDLGMDWHKWCIKLGYRGYGSKSRDLIRIIKTYDLHQLDREYEANCLFFEQK